MEQQLHQPLFLFLIFVFDFCFADCVRLLAFNPVVEISLYVAHKVWAVLANDVVGVIGVDHVVDEFALFDGGVEQLLAMLPNHSAVHGTVDYQQTTL